MRSAELTPKPQSFHTPHSIAFTLRNPQSPIRN